MANTYDIGDIVRVSSAFTQSGVAVDPTTVSLIVLAPDRTATTYTVGEGTVLKDSAGNYHVDVPATQTGTYRYRWVSTGTGAAAEEGFFEVRTQRVV